MAFDTTIFAAKAKAALAVALTPAFEPQAPTSKEDEPAFAEEQGAYDAQRRQIEAAKADAVKRAAVQSIAIAVGERAAELWAGLELHPGAALVAADDARASDIDVAAYRAIAFYLSTVKE